MVFVLKFLFYRNSSTNIIFHDKQGSCTDTNPQKYSVPYTIIFSGATSCKFWRNMQQKRGCFKFKMCLLKSHHKIIVSIVYLCEDLWCTEKYPLPKCIFSGAKSCKIWRKLVKKRNFGLKCLYRNSCTEVISFLLSSSYKFLTLPNLQRKKS